VTDTLDLRFARASTFEPLVGGEFVSGDPEASFLLVDVTQLGSQPHAPRADPFVLTFVGVPGLAQRIYELDHPSLGRLELFLVPIGPGPDGRERYEAVFN
jgi:uncharacterized protein DUF6916